MQTIILNSTNVDPTDNSRYVYSFPLGGVDFSNMEIAVSAISLYYSWFNISAALGNNTFSYFWSVGAGTTVNITIDDGFYTAASLNAFLQSRMIANNHYLIDSVGDFVYFLEFVENATQYAIQFNSYAIPTAAQAAALGYTAPAGWGGYPAAAITPQLIVAANNFRNIIGFNAGTYPTPTQATNYSKISDFTPQFSPVQSVFLRCDLANNQLSNPSDIIYSFAPTNVDFGSLIVPTISEFIWNRCRSGSRPSFFIQFLDQSFKPLPIRDTNLVVVLSIKPLPQDVRNNNALKMQMY